MAWPALPKFVGKESKFCSNKKKLLRPNLPSKILQYLRVIKYLKILNKEIRDTKLICPHKRQLGFCLVLQQELNNLIRVQYNNSIMDYLQSNTSKIKILFKDHTQDKVLLTKTTKAVIPS